MTFEALNTTVFRLRGVTPVSGTHLMPESKYLYCNKTRRFLLTNSQKWTVFIDNSNPRMSNSRFSVLPWMFWRCLTGDIKLQAAKFILKLKLLKFEVLQMFKHSRQMMFHPFGKCEIRYHSYQNGRFRSNKKAICYDHYHHYLLIKQTKYSFPVFSSASAKC